MKKIFTSIVAVCFAAALWAQGGVVRLYCQMTYSWWTSENAAVGAYLYGNEEVHNAAWPGVRMTDMGNGLWYIDADTTVYQYIIFTRVNGSDEVVDWGAKTADLTIPTDGNNLYTITSAEAVWGDPGVTGEWSYYDGTTGTGGVTITSYSLVGDSALFGGVNWDVTNEATNMTQTGDYTWIYTIASVYLKAYRNYEYKVVANHSWGVADYPSGSNNYILAVEQSGTYQVQFTFDSSTECAATANLIQADESGSGTDYSNYAAVINLERMVQFVFSGTDEGDISQYEAHVQLNQGDTLYIRDRSQNVMLEFSVEEYGAYNNFTYTNSGSNYNKIAYVVCQQSGCYDLFYKSNYSLYLGEGTGGCSEGEPYDEGSMQTAHVSLYGDYGYVYINDNVSSGDFVLGSTITLSAQPYSNYQFLEWSDGNYANPRQFIVTGDTTISASFGSKAFYPTGILLNRKKFIRSTFNDGTQLIVRANIAQGDTVELYFINDNIFWMAPVEQYGAYQNFSGGEAEGRLICNVAGCYDIYFKLEDGLTQSIYIGEGTQCFDGEDWVSPIRITQEVCYLIGKNDILGAWDLAQARPISKDGTTFTLPAGMYQFKLLPQNDSWENSYGYSYVYAPCSSANIATDGDGNIVIAVEEDTDVTISFGDNGICLTGNFTQANTGVHLTTGASPEEAGIVSVESGDYLLEQELTLQASISTGGWEFDKWSDDVTDNPRTVKLTQDTTIMAIFTPGEYGILINRRQLARGTFTGRIEGSYIAQFKSSVTLQQGDKIQLINLTHGTNSTWRPELEDGGLSANFSIHESDEQKHQSLVCNLSGCYDIYSKIHYGQSNDVLYIGAGEDCQPTEYFPIDLTDSITGYSVVGTANLFGTAWDVSDRKTEMSLSPMGVYIYTLDSVTLLPDSIYQYKIIANHTWNVDEYPSIEGGDNYYISVQNAGVYSVTFTLTQGERGGAAINYLHAIPASCTPIASGECGADGDNLTWVLDCDSVLTISGYGAMADYSGSSSVPWHDYQSMIRRAVISSGVTSLSSSSTFENCTALQSVVIPEGITSLGMYTFSNCTSLKGVDLPSTLLSIGSYCFSECWAIDSITCRATTPPEANGSSLSGVNYMIPIYVPAGTAEIYKAADGWSGFTDYRDIENGGSSPTEAAPTPTYLVTQVKAIYSPTYDADCDFGEWGSGTTYTQDTYGKKFVTTDLGYFGLGFPSLNCTNMEYLHFDIWITANSSVRVVPIWGGEEQGITKNLTANKWNSVDIPLSEFDAVTDWYNVYQVKIDNAANMTLWVGNAYFYTKQAVMEDNEAPANVTGTFSLASCFSTTLILSATDNSGSVMFSVRSEGKEVATIAGASSTPLNVTITNLRPSTMYTFSIVVKDEVGNEAAPITVTATTLSAPASAPAPDIIGKHVVPVFCDAIENTPTINIGGWGQTTTAMYGELTDGDHAYCCINFNYLGLEISPAVDASDMDYLHVDIYTTDMQYISVTPISPTHEGTKTVQLTANKWTPIDISINDYADASIDWSNIYQFKFFDANPTGTTLIFDNIYFYHSDGDEDSTIKHGITWIANSVILQIDSISEGNNITSLPDTPSSCSTGQVFAGWTDAPIDNVQSEAPAPLYTSVADIPAITEDMTLYAVYATDSASYIFDAVRQEGWTNTANLTSGSYWLLNSESELVSPEIDLTRLKTITMTIRSYGGTSNNTVNVYANNQQIATIIAPDKTLKEVTWTNDQLLSGSASIHFKTNYSGSAGVGFSSVTIEIDSDRKYSTTCDTPYCVLEDGTCGVDGSNIMWSLSCDSVLTISGQGVMKDYSNSPWGDKKEAIKTVRFEGEITNIGKYAFYYCRNLTNIIIPESITIIGDYAFAGCTGLTSIDIPESVTSIGKAAFYYCQGLMFFTIPSGVTRIESSTFAECFALTSISIPSGITSIGSGAFQGCNYLDSIIIPDGVTSIENNVFYDCFSLTSIIIPERVTSIGEKAFFDCVGLTSISIPNGVTSIGDDAFWGCYSLVSATISNRVTSIGNNVFYGCKGLPSIIIPDSVKSIGDSAFEGCTGLTSIIIPDSLISIGTKAFFSCNGLTSIVIPEGVQSIGDNAFFGCSKLSKISIPRKMTSIGNSVFGNCSGLTSITIPDNITSIGQSAFSGCSGLTSIIIPSSVKSIGSVAFSNCSRLDTISLPNSVTSIGSYAFNECVNLTSITIPDSVTSIENNVFSYCNKLSSITIPNGVRSIGKEAFHYCVKLAVINLPSSISSIGEMAFYGCRALTSINIPDGVTSIEKSVFSSCSGLTSVTIPKNVTSIGDGAFENCSKITSISIPNSVTSIGGSAFANDSTLLSITIPEKVTSIGIYTFSNCINLASITCKSPNPPIVEAYAFENVNKSILVYVPAESVGLYSESSGWREFSNIKAMNGGEPITSYSVVGDSVLIGMNWNVESMQTEMTRGADGVSWTYVIDSVALKANIQYKFKIIANHTWSVAQYPSENEDYILTVPKDDDYTVTFTFVLGKGGTATAVHYPQRILVEDFTPQDGSTTTYVTTPTTKICSQAEWTFYLGGVLENIGKFDSYAAIVRAKKSSETEYGYILSSPISGGINDLWFTWNSNGTEEGQNWDVKIYVNDILAGSITEPGTAQLTEKPFNTFKVSNLKVAGDFTIKIVNESPYTGTSNKLRLVIDDLSWTAYDGYSGESQGDCDSFTGECGAQGNNLTWSLNCDSVLTISGTGAMAEYEYIETNNSSTAPWDKEAIKTLIIGDGVTSLGKYAFYRCSNLTDIQFGTGLVYIGDNAFDMCEALPELTIPGSVRNIGAYAFSTCTGLTNVTLQEGVDSLWIGVFNWCQQLSSIELSPSLKFIDDKVFRGCTGLHHLTLPASVSHMGLNIFEDCTGLDTLYCENSTPAEISASTFDSTILASCVLVVPNGSGAQYQSANYWSEFANINEKKCILASGECGAQGDNVTWSLSCDSIITISGTGAMASYSTNSNGQAPWAEYGSQINEIVIEEGVTSIGAYSFYNAGSYTNGAYNNVRSVTIPSTVTKLQNNYFYQCPVQTVTLNSDSIVGQTTYSSNASLHKMFGAQVRQYIIGDSVKSIANSVFYNQSADSLKSILLPEGLTSIGSWAFGYLENLDSITLPRSLQSIGSDAFYGSGLRAVTIPGSVTDMGGQAFQNCDKLASVILEEGLTTLGTSAFQNCTALTEITIPESMVTISSGAFTDCTHLTKMTVLATAWVSADKSSSSTTKLAIGNYVRELILGDQIPTIGKYAFSSLDSLRTVTLPFNVTSLSNYAFSSCPSLACVISNALTPPTIQTNTFSRQDTLIVPCESKQLYKTAQYWQNFNRIRCADDQEMSISLTGNWTFIMVPSTFGMDAGDVTTEGDVQWATYNGSVRAMGRSGWENYSAEAVHMCSQALIVRATGETATLHINVPTNATAMVGTTVSLIPNAAALPQNANWCFTGNPYPYGYLLSGLAAQGITSPIAVWNGTGYDTYTPGIDDYIIPAFGAFFIQLPEGTVEPTVINFSAEYIYM